MKAFKACFAGLEDPRKGRYDLLEMPGLRWGTASSSGEDCHDMAEFAQAKFGGKLAGFGGGGLATCGGIP